MNAQISFIDGQFSLIHIPLSLYGTLLQAVLSALIPFQLDAISDTPSNADEETGSSCEQRNFFNVSVTPIECSIVCHTALAQSVFRPAIARLAKEDQKNVSISKDSYMVFSVSSAGMEAGQRVMDLTAPLAMVGISIFFITTYYTDFILVPSRDHQTVIAALLERGFEFSERDAAYVTPVAASHARPIGTNLEPPSTPPPANVAELQARTFAHLKRRNVMPFVESGLHLLQCSGHETPPLDEYASRNGNRSAGSSSDGHWLDRIDSKLYLGLVAALLSQPRFLSVTLSKDDAPSLLLDKTLLPLFGRSIAGDPDGELVPIFLDLSNLPLDSTGIVCGVAGRLVEQFRDQDLAGAELSYLSTARAGAVILSLEGSTRALEALLPLLKDE